MYMYIVAGADDGTTSTTRLPTEEIPSQLCNDVKINMTQEGDYYKFKVRTSFL